MRTTEARRLKKQKEENIKEKEEQDIINNVFRDTKIKELEQKLSEFEKIKIEWKENADILHSLYLAGVIDFDGSLVKDQNNDMN